MTETNPADPAPPTDAAACGCPHDGSLAMADPTAQHGAMLAELGQIGMVLARTLERQVEATGRVGAEEAALYEGVSRAVRRTVALHAKLHADSRMSEEQRAAERASRAAAAALASLRARKDAVRRAVEDTIRADAERCQAAPGDTERLLGDLHERLLDPDIEAAFGQRDNSAIILGICKDLYITPRDEIWSDKLMEVEIPATAAALRRVAEDRLPPDGSLADDVVAASPATAGAGGVHTKIGRFTCGPTGAVVRVDPPDEPSSDEPSPDWPTEILSGRDPPDAGRRWALSPTPRRPRRRAKAGVRGSDVPSR